MQYPAHDVKRARIKIRNTKGLAPALAIAHGIGLALAHALAPALGLSFLFVGR